MGFFCQKQRERKCLFLCSGRGGKKLEKSDTLNYTNIQCKTAFLSVWMANRDWKSLLLHLLVLHCRDPPVTEATLLMQSTCPERQRIGERTGVTFTIVYHYKCKQYIHITTFDMLKIRHKFLVFLVASIFALKKDFVLMQVTLEEWFAVDGVCRNINWCIVTSLGFIDLFLIWAVSRC